MQYQQRITAALAELGPLSQASSTGMCLFHYTRIAVEFIQCNRVLVFGAGHDTKLWAACVGKDNVRVVENAETWARVAAAAGVTVHHVAYDSKPDVWMPEPKPPIGIPSTLPGLNSILVDGPRGDLFGREQSVYAANLMRITFGCSVFLHDYERVWDKAVADEYLGPPDEVLEYDSQGRKLAFWKRKE